MSEKVHMPETLEQLAHHEELLPAHGTPDKVSEKTNTSLDAEKARQAVAETAVGEQQTNPLEQLQVSERAEAETAAPQRQLINRDLRQVTLRRELQDIRRKLPASQRTLSRIIHQPGVRAISEVSAKTISRPSGLLGGGLVAFLGTTSYLYFAKHVGVRYNYLLVVLLFAGGFIVGLGLELAVYLATASHRSHD